MIFPPEKPVPLDTRRRALLAGAGATLLAMGCKASSAAEPGAGVPRNPIGDDDVAPPEDLMREHGGLNRILLIYDTCAERLAASQAFPIEVLGRSADLLRRFIEQYHEKLEEDFLFPRFEKANQHVALVTTLRRQHVAGRVLTDTISRLASAASLSQEPARKQLIDTLHAFNRMYRPHEAREDTVLFPAFRELVTKKEMHELGEQFEAKEHQLFGKEGFEGIVVQIAGLERELGIFELDQFTPQT